MSWGKWGKQFSAKEQADLIQFCVDQGNNTFDHADIYGGYSTEADFGWALKRSDINRSNIQLISKCGIQLVTENRDNKIKHYNYSKDYIIWSAEQSLKALQTDYLDTFLLHRPSPLMHVDEVAEAIVQLKLSGKIKSFGVSNFTSSQVDLLANEVEVSVNQIEFSLTHHEAMLNGTLDHLQLKNIETLSWSPLGSIYKTKDEQVARIRPVLDTLSEKYEVTDDTLLLSWILKHPAAISPVIGTTNHERIQNANKALELDLELEDWFLMLKAATGKDVE